MTTTTKTPGQEDGFFLVGKLYRVKHRYVIIDGEESSVIDKLAVYGADEAAFRTYVWLETGDVVMWLGTAGCKARWARVLHKDGVWYINLTSAHRMTERVLL